MEREAQECKFWNEIHIQWKVENNEQLLDEAFVISRIIKVEVGVIAKAEGRG